MITHKRLSKFGSIDNLLGGRVDSSVGDKQVSSNSGDHTGDHLELSVEAMDEVLNLPASIYKQLNIIAYGGGFLLF